MINNIRFGNRSLLCLLFLSGILTGYAWAETIELVTYYPSSGGGGTDPQVNSIRVGSGYAGTAAPSPGVALIETSLGIGIAAPNFVLDVNGVDSSNRLNVAKFGSRLPVYLMQDSPSIGFNTFQGAGFPSPSLYGVGSVNNYAGKITFATNTGAFSFSNTTVTGNAGALAALQNRMMIDRNGNLGIGTAAPGSTLHVVEPAGGGGAVASFVRYSEDVTPPNLFLVHGRGTAAAPTRPLFNDGLGLVRFQGVNTAAQNYDGATIQSVAAENWTAASAPAVLIFSTTAASAIVSTERMRITQVGNVGIGTAGAPAASALLELNSTQRGFLPPRMNDGQRDAIETPVAGLTIYNTTTNQLNTYNGAAWTAAARGGPRFVTRTKIYDGNGTGWTTYANTGTGRLIPAGATAVILQAYLTDGGQGDGYLISAGKCEIRRNSSSTADVLLDYYCGVFNTTSGSNAPYVVTRESSEGVFPVTATGTFDYTVSGIIVVTGYTGNCKIWIKGYYE